MKNTISICLICAWLLIGPKAMAQTAIGGTSLDPSAMLDVQSNEKGLLIPRMSTSERIGITSPANGLIIFNTTENRLQINMGGPGAGNASWQSFFVAGQVTGFQTSSASDILYDGLAASVTVTVPYIGGNGGDYLGQIQSSKGIPGLVAVLEPGRFQLGSGNLVFSITGTPVGIGNAEFPFFIGGLLYVLVVAITT